MGRSDYGIYLPILRRIHSDPGLQLHLIVAGMHLSPEYGRTAEVIEADGFEISERVEMLLSSDHPQGIAKSIGLGVIGFAQSYARCKPDILVVLGDRFEMYSSALAALPFKIPIAHIHGGEVTRGAIDEALRHGMTKFSHLHFVATKEYARRVMQLGEEPWRVFVTGAPGLDNLSSIEPMDRDQLERRIDLCLEEPPLLVTYHPVTLEYEQTEWQMTELLAALEEFQMPMVFTLPNADTSGRIVRDSIRKFLERHPRATMVDNLGTEAYFSLMRLAQAMLGNSSSGIIEAASFGLPVVNIGSRQKGRIKGDNVIDVGYCREAIVECLKRSISPEFRRGLHGMVNPYGCGQAADKIVERLSHVELDDRLIKKVFYDIDTLQTNP